MTTACCQGNICRAKRNIVSGAKCQKRHLKWAASFSGVRAFAPHIVQRTSSVAGSCVQLQEHSLELTGICCRCTSSRCRSSVVSCHGGQQKVMADLSFRSLRLARSTGGTQEKVCLLPYAQMPAISPMSSRAAWILATRSSGRVHMAVLLSMSQNTCTWAKEEMLRSDNNLLEVIGKHQ